MINIFKKYKLIVINKDTPGVIGKIGSLLGDLNINIASYLLGRVDDSEDAYSVIKLDASIPSKVLNTFEELDDIVKVWQVKVG